MNKSIMRLRVRAAKTKSGIRKIRLRFSYDVGAQVDVLKEEIKNHKGDFHLILSPLAKKHISDLSLHFDMTRVTIFEEELVIKEVKFQ